MSITAQGVHAYNVLDSRHEACEGHLCLIWKEEQEISQLRTKLCILKTKKINKNQCNLTRCHHLGVGRSQAVLGGTGDSVASDWSAGRSPAHCEGVVTHVSQFHVGRGLDI